MKQLLATITASQSLTANLRLLTLSSPDLPQLRAGQLILARANDSFDPYLRRAYFPIPSLTSPDTCSILVEGKDAPTARLYNVGDTLDMIAPIGNGFTLDASTRQLLLIGDEDNLAPLIALAHEATQKQIAVTLLIVGRDGDAPAGRLYGSLLPLDVEYQLVSARDVAPDLLRWADQICAVSSTAMYAQLKEHIAQAVLVTRTNFTQVIVAVAMACGFGACLACAVETTHGMRLACVDGPVFDLMEI